MAFITAFGFVFTLTILLNSYIFGEKMKLHRRVTEVVGTSALIPLRQQELSFPLYQRFIKPFLTGVVRILTKYVPAAREEILAKKLIEAGRPFNLAPRELLVIKYLLGALGIFFINLTWRTSGEISARNLMTALALGIFGWLLPDVYINSKASGRKEHVNRELPEVLDLLTVCIEAGLGFDGAIMKVVEKSKGVLPNELYLVLQEIRMGKPRRDALREMADRLSVDELSSFVGSIIMAEQLGIGIGNVLRLQSKEIRQKRRQRVEEMAMKAPVKMLIPMVMFIFPAIFIILLGPAALQIMRVFGE